MITILFVEDDPLEARMIMPLLEKGFGDVRRATDAADALCAIEGGEFADHIGLVVSGRFLKGMRKPEFVAELHERMPKLPVLVLGTADDSPGDYMGENVAFLPRPLAPRQMVSLVSRLVADHQDSAA
jgi:DNA-binding NtrC family response regulator